MSIKPIPEDYHTVTPYLIVPGVEQLIHFIGEAFDGKERTRMTTPDGQIMHAEVMVGDSVLMMGNVSPEFPPRPATLHLYVMDVDSVYQRALNAGAKSLQVPEDQFYGDRSAGVEDRHGNQWWIATHVRDVSDEEIRQFMESGSKD
jgi:PhnB protein